MRQLSDYLSNLSPDALPLLGMVALLCLGCLLLGRGLGVLESQRRRGKDRKDAVKRSKAVITGMVGEQIAPLLPGFPCGMEEARFIGKPVDFVAFCSKDGRMVDEILFIEVKTGASSLSPREQSIKRAVQEKRVRYVEYRPL